MINEKDTVQTPETEEPQKVSEEAAGTAQNDAEVPAEENAGKGKKGSETKKLRAENKELSEKLAAAQADAAEQKDKYLRTLAEYDNYRKRTVKEREGIYADAKADCVNNLLALFDNLERASAFEGEQAAEGVKMILASVPDVLGKMNITAFGAAGETFDPALHNAVMHVDDEQYGEGEILEVFQKGYRVGEKIIRYAMVKTAN